MRSLIVKDIPILSNTQQKHREQLHLPLTDTAQLLKAFVEW